MWHFIAKTSVTFWNTGILSQEVLRHCVFKESNEDECITTDHPDVQSLGYGRSN